PEGYSGSETAHAVFVSGSNLYVVTYECLFRTVEDEGGLIYESSEKVHLKRYDVSDPANPVIVGDFAQSGQYLDSMCVNGRIYLISACGIWAPIPDDASTFVPVITRNGEDQLLAAEDITICPGLDSTDYTVVSVINAESGEDLKTHALTGYHAWSAAEGDRLYLARTAYDYTESEAHTEDQYKVVDHAYNAFTRIVALKLDDTLELSVSTAVEGALFGTGAFTANNGEIYLAVKEDGYAYQTYTDEKYGFVNILMQEEKRGNAVYALDAELELARGLRDIADAVYTVYFAGTQACVLGYDTLVPAFVVDMTQSELNAQTGPASICRNLYRFSDGMSAGIGPVRDGSGAITGLGLAMYDTSSAAFTELSAIKVGENWGSALAMTGAVHVLPELQMIAVPTDTGYAVFSWNGSAWSETATVELGYVTAETKLFVAGDTAYFCNDAMILAVSTSDWSEIARVEFAYG
ncbi:MAG: beta-propeller domain-containing protein, partial [Oscillospiraceae bacterium]|nr:beta-propeller domain-containing protein [Oscillospiraceae bacterium]